VLEWLSVEKIKWQYYNGSCIAIILENVNLIGVERASVDRKG